MTTASEMVLAPLGALYGAVTRARLTLYRTGALHVNKLAVPVVSVGNITTGGTGKTPLVEWVARTIAGEGRRVCILTRGYGRINARERVVVSDGERVLADDREGGDEPLLLAEMLRGVAAVISDADRVSAAGWALENLGSEVFVLDDGFQHLRLARDLDIATVDATNPWGGGRLLPRGRLREPPGGLARADCIVITRADQAQDIDTLKKQVERLSGGRPLLFAHTRTKRVRPLSVAAAEYFEEADLRSQPAAAFCAIGNSQAFFSQARGDGHALNYTRAFPDHHFYTQGDVAALEAEAERRGARLLLTTAKDAVKLRPLKFRLPCYVLEIELRFDEEDKLREIVREAVTAGRRVA